MRTIRAYFHIAKHRKPGGRHRAIVGAGALEAAQRYMINLGDGWRLICA